MFEVHTANITRMVIKRQEKVPSGEFTDEVIDGLIPSMNVYTTRLANTLTLIEKKWRGKATNLASALDMQQSAIARLFMKGSANRRNIGFDLARRIEQASGEPEGWLDTPHNSDNKVVSANSGVDGLADEEKNLLLAYRQADERGKAAITVTAEREMAMELSSSQRATQRNVIREKVSENKSAVVNGSHKFDADNVHAVSTRQLFDDEGRPIAGETQKARKAKK